MKTLGVVLAGALVLVAVAPGDAQVSFDGKKNSFHTATAIPLPGVSGPVLVGTIAKGKTKSVLTIEAMVTSEQLVPIAPWTLNAFVEVNGIAADPTAATPPFGAVQDCGSDAFAGPYGSIAEGCTVAGTWIVDLDAAELLSPGCCINVPLTVTLRAGPGLNVALAGIPVSASLAVRMEKKR